MVDVTGMHKYVGEYASDALALTYIQSKKWDTNGNGTGNPQTGMSYFNTVSNALKIYENGAWRFSIRADGSVPFSANQSMGSHKITNVTNPTSAQDAATKDYVDGAVSGYRVPVKVLKIYTDSNYAGITPPVPAAGIAYQVNGWGVGYNDGEIWESNGAAWVKIVGPGLGGLPPDGTRCIVGKGPGLAGSFIGHGNAIAQFNAGTAVWDFTSPTDGDIAAVIGGGSYYENHMYIYDSTTDLWVDFGSTVAHNATTGKEGAGPEYYHLSQAQYNALTGAGDASAYHNHTSLYPNISHGNGTPEGSVTGKIGDIYIDDLVPQIYMKKSGAGNTGWGAI